LEPSDAGDVGGKEVDAAQEANVDGPSVVAYPTGRDWDVARRAAGLETTAHDDMHGGEAETSILLHYAPDSIAAERRTRANTGKVGVSGRRCS
jgi:creatinine amidohydrolase/Fe(II)-dependent formamide hydrolase-like protein